MSEYRLAEKPALNALVAMGWQMLSPAQALAMREEENRVILKPVLIDALRTLNGIGADDAEAIYNDLSTLSDNEEWQRKLRGGYSRRLSGENRDSPIALIDFQNPARNSFHVTHQFRVTAMMPGCESSRSWLDRHQSALSASFLAEDGYWAYPIIRATTCQVDVFG